MRNGGLNCFGLNSVICKCFRTMDLSAASEENNNSLKNDPSISTCKGCGFTIHDRFMLQVSGFSWHAKCLKCSSCGMLLENESICYLRNSVVFCRTDYQRLFCTKCAKCSRPISASDWVRRARDQVYHLACFACDGCKRQLSTGEHFALADDKVLCKLHFQELFDDGHTSNEDSCEDGDGSSSSSSKSKTKRVRTTFTDEQLQVLQANFQLDSNPDGQDLERIAQITGLSKRVTQVWFQNSRARQKKHMAKQKKNFHHHNSQHHLLQHRNNNESSSFEKSTTQLHSSQLSDSDSASGASPLTTMLYTFN